MLKKYLPYFDIDLDNATHKDYIQQSHLMWGMAKLNSEDVALYDAISTVVNDSTVDIASLAGFYFLVDDEGFRDLLRESIDNYENSLNLPTAAE
jgi:hypothetical protein